MADKFILGFPISEKTADSVMFQDGTDVGIGTDDPNAKLDVAGAIMSTGTSTYLLSLNNTAQDTRIQFKQSGTEYGQISAGSNLINIVASGASTDMRFLTNSAERMRITSAGVVQIINEATTTSSANLFIKGKRTNNTDGAFGEIVFSNNNDTVATIAGFRDTADNKGSLVFQTQNGVAGFGTRMSISSAGNIEFKNGTLKVGDSTTAELLIIPSSDGFAPALLQFHKTDTAAQTVLQFLQNNSQKGSITYSGTSTSFNTTSDYRLKEDLKDFAGLDIISNIPVYDYKWKSEDSRAYGMMAHELQEVLPQAVSGEKDATEEYEITPAVLDEEGNVSEEAVMGTRDVCQGVDYSKIVPLLVKSIQELKAEIELLKLNTP